jgi:hypothetical protein
LTSTTPMIESASPSCTGRRERRVARSRWRMVSSRFGEIDHLDLAARRHQSPGRAVGEAHDAGDHLALVALDARRPSRPRR